MIYDHYERKCSARRIQLIGTRLSITALMLCTLVVYWRFMMDFFGLPSWMVLPISALLGILGTFALLVLSVVVHILTCFFSWLSGN